MGAMTSTEGDKLLIDAVAEKDLECKPRIKTASGLEYQELVVGKGPTPTVGIQVCSRSPAAGAALARGRCLL